MKAKTFHVDELIVMSGPPVPSELQIGDLVQLRSGSPSLEVIEIDGEAISLKDRLGIKYFFNIACLPRISVSRWN